MTMTLNFDTSLEAWEQINEMFITNDPLLQAYYKSKALYTHQVLVNIRCPKLDPKFNFGRYFNYTKSKWQSLVSNYLDLDELYSLKQQIQGKKEYNLGFQFKNKHGHGKGCLLSATITRIAKATPRITLFARACEVTKRLPMDLLLIQRIGEYLFEEGEFSVSIFFNQMFNDDLVLLMYHTHHDIYDVFDKDDILDDDRRDQLLPRLKEALKTDPTKVKYKVHRRVIKVLRPDLMKYPKLLAKDCKLIIPDNEKLRKAYQQELPF